MATPTAAAAAVIGNASHSGEATVYISNYLGSLVQIGTAGGEASGADVVEGVDVTWQVDAHGTCTLRLRRQLGLFNWSPFFIGAPNALQASNAVVDVGRRVYIVAKATPPDASGANSPDGGIPIFEGVVDAVSPPDDVITVTCSDLTGVMRDTFIEKERMYGFCTGATKGALVWRYDLLSPLTINEVLIPSKGKQNGHWYYVSALTTGIPSAAEPTWPTGGGATVVSGGVTFKEGGATSTVGHPVQTVMSQIISDNTDAGRLVGPPTLYVPVSPGWTIKPYVQGRMSMLKAVETFAEQLGWRLHMWFDQGDTVGAGDELWYLRLIVPDRTRVTVDKIIPVDHEIECTELERNIFSIRNAVHVVYGDAASRDPAGLPTRITVIRTDATSITAYGRRFMEICEDDVSAIDTATEAGQFADACLADLKEPTAGMAVEAPYDPYVEVGLMVQIPADNLRFGADQLLAAEMVRHTFGDGVARLGLTLRGKPVARRAGWMKFDVRQRGNESHMVSLADGTGFTETVTPTIGGVRVSSTENTTGRKQRTGGREIHISDSAAFTPGPSTMKGVDNGDGQPVEIFNLVPGKTQYRKSVPFTFNASRKVRGSPTDEGSFVVGRAKAGHYDSTSTQSHLPLNGNFEHAIDDLASFPPDHWNVVTRPAETTEVWGSGGSVYYGTEATTKGRYIVLRASATQRGNLVSDAFEVRRAIRAFNLYLSIRRQGSSAVSGKDLIVDIAGYSDAALTNQIINYSVTLSGSAAGAYPTTNVWYDATVDLAAAGGALGTAVNFITLGIRRGTAGDNSFSWEVGDIYFQEADFIAARIDTATIGTLGNTLTHVRAKSATAGSYANGATIVWDAEDYDTLAEFVHTTGIFTCTKAGYYSVSAAIFINSLAYNLGNSVQLQLQKNGAGAIAYGYRWYAASTASWYATSSVKTTVLLAVGDTLRVYVGHDRAAGNLTLFADSAANYITIDRIL